MYQIIYSSDFAKQIKKIPVHIKDKFFDKTETLLLKDPYQGKQLKWRLEGKFSLRVNREYRIIYKIDKNIIKILSIEHRSSSYRLFGLLISSISF